MKSIIILGTGGNCIDILEAVHALGLHCAGFLDDNPETWERSIYGVPVLGGLREARRYGDCLFVNGIGSPKNFSRKALIIASTGLAIDRFTTVIHPTASVSKMAEIGRGTVLLPHVTVASGVHIGNHVMVLPASIISHDDTIGDYATIAGGVCISGGVVVGASCYLGTNCSVIGNVSIGDGALVGMGAVVLRDVPPGAVVVGNPARVLRTTAPDHTGLEAASS